jgi:hypothetical protein
MIPCPQHRPTANSYGGKTNPYGTQWYWAVMTSIFLTVLAAAGFGMAAGWLAPASDQTVTAPWVKDIAAQLEREPYRDVLVNAPGEPPNPVVVRYLNSAARALQAGNKLLAQSYIDRTIGIFDSGVLRGHYSRSDVDPIKKLIRERGEGAMSGEEVSVALEQKRWTGYTNQEPLGLAGESARMKREHPVDQ